MSRRLADLSDRELAPLFNMTIPEIRRYRQPSTDKLSWEWSTEAEKAEHERHQEWLWNLSVEEFRALLESDDQDAEKTARAERPRRCGRQVSGAARASEDPRGVRKPLSCRFRDPVS